MQRSSNNTGHNDISSPFAFLHAIDPVCNLRLNFYSNPGRYAVGTQGGAVTACDLDQGTGDLLPYFILDFDSDSVEENRIAILINPLWAQAGQVIQVNGYTLDLTAESENVLLRVSDGDRITLCNALPDEQSITFVLTQTNTIRVNHEISTSYKIDYVLGKGSFGVAAKAKSIISGESVVIKIVRPNSEGDLMPLDDIDFEASILRQLKPSGGPIISIIDFVQDTKNLVSYLILESAEHGTLSDFIRRFPDGMDEEQARHITAQLCDLLLLLKRNHIVHRDIKPANIVLTSREPKPTIKAIDFGLAYMNQHMFTDRCGTHAYLSPEVVCPRGPVPPYNGFAVDVFSVGKTALEMQVFVYPHTVVFG
ncbi:kinase-like domain-containing protein [Vararia minispora EC-137]|uniref:Kinase-like domain-containing protein n=1 Tax=Vararia minispora EC-137 TaxID=1314806 RepID=A0ACB8QQE3_9AGAM|nr:kinase-like domain-containing protein [Vararia minispora EC-137]